MNPLSIGQKVVASLALAIILVLSVSLALAIGNERHWHKIADSCAAARAKEQADTRVKTADAKAADAKHVVEVGEQRTKVSVEKDDDYQTKLADLQRRYDADRLHWSEGRADPNGSGGAGMPEVSEPAGEPGPTAAPGPNDFNCAANTIQLGSLIDWVKAQVAIPN